MVVSYYNFPNAVRMYVWMLMKGSFRFDPDNAKFRQNIRECTGRVKKLYSTEIGAELTEKSMQMCFIAIKMPLKTVEIRQDFSVGFSFASVLFYEQMNMTY